MRHLKYLFAAAAVGSLMAFPQTSSATPLGSALGSVGPAIPVLGDDLVQKVHGWHCGKRRGWYHGHRAWHRHYRACHRTYYRKRYYDDYDDDYDDDDYPYAYSYPYYSAPFIGFSFGSFGHRRHHHWNWDD
jgi:hypothetical protein